MMLAIYILIAVFIAWIWVDYYRLIDVYEQDELKYFILTFFIGAGSVSIVYGFHSYVFSLFVFEQNGNFLNDLLYCVFKIGLLEEFAKTVPFLLMLLLFKKQFNEPLDYLSFICVSALGFSAAENAMYFYRDGASILGRGILSTVGHMFDTSLVAYGIIRYKFVLEGRKTIQLLLFIFLAAFSHGLYDFLLMYEGLAGIGPFLLFIYFLLTISVFATILNNALNNSSFFTYKKVINSSMVAKRLLTYYAVLYVVHFGLSLKDQDLMHSLQELRAAIFLPGFIIVVTCVRLSRFKLIQNRWNPIQLELPFSYSAPDDIDPTMMRYGQFRIKGEPYNEAYINSFYQEYSSLNPVSPRNSYLEDPRKCFIERKLFLKFDQTFYLANVYTASGDQIESQFLLRPKTRETTMINDLYPIVALLQFNNASELTNEENEITSFEFLEWVYLKPNKQGS